MKSLTLNLPETGDATPGPAEPGSYGVRPPGFRLPDETRLGQVRLQVGDLVRSLAYYEGVLGFRVLERTGDRASLGAPGDDTPLIELEERSGAAPVPRHGRLGLYHFAILLPDRAALGRFVGHLAGIGAHAGASDHLVSEALYLHDPDGLGIEVYADRPRSTWRRQGRELAMSTLPLNGPDLVQAAGGHSWTGMPAGTAIGHVHLHVGDLDRAAAFFHAALGLDATVWSYPGALFLSAGGYHHHLGLNTWAGAGATPPQTNDARLLEWEVVVPSQGDVEAAALNMERVGFPVTRFEWGWRAADPWATQLRLRCEHDPALPEHR